MKIYETEFHENMPIFVKKALTVFDENNIKAYIAGGAVRDLLIGEAPHDYDIATEAPPEVVMTIFSEKGIRCFATDKEVSFGRCSIIVDDEELEITTFRIDGEYSNSRHPDNCGFNASMEEDSNRRDFTMNSLYLSVDGKVYDYHNGFDDALNGIVRFVGKASERINEDNLRILRLFRFCLRYECFNTYNLWLLREHSWKLKNIAPERVKMEMEKIFKERKNNTVLHLFETPILNVLFGNTIIENVKVCNQITKYHPEVSLVNHINIFYNNLIETSVEDSTLYWTAIMHDLGKPECESREVKEGGREVTHYYEHEYVSLKIATEFMDRYKFSNEEHDKISYLIEQHMRISQVQRMKNKKLKRFMRDKYFGDLMTIHNADDMIEVVSPDCVFLDKKFKEFGDNLEPLVSGKDLIERGLKPGEHFGGILRRCEDIQHEYNLKTKEEILDMYFNRRSK